MLRSRLSEASRSECPGKRCNAISRQGHYIYVGFRLRSRKTDRRQAKPELLLSLLLTQRGRAVHFYLHLFFSRFYEPGARPAVPRPTTQSKPNAPKERCRFSDRTPTGRHRNGSRVV